MKGGGLRTLRTYSYRSFAGRSWQVSAIQVDILTDILACHRVFTGLCKVQSRRSTFEMIDERGGDSELDTRDDSVEKRNVTALPS